MVGPARGARVLVHRAVHPGCRCRPVAAVYRLGSCRRCRPPRRTRTRSHQATPPPRHAVAAARRGRCRGGRRVPTAHLARAHHRLGEPRCRRDRAAPRGYRSDGGAAHRRAPRATVLDRCCTRRNRRRWVCSAPGRRLRRAVLARSAAVRRGARGCGRLCGGRTARAGARRLADNLVGARRRLPAHARPHRVRGSRSSRRARLRRSGRRSATSPS